MKRSYWKPEVVVYSLIAMVFLASCSKNLSKLSRANPSVGLDSSLVKSSPKVVSKSIGIDTVVNPMGPSISFAFSDPYYNSRVGSKVSQLYRLNGVQTKWLNDIEPSTLYFAVIEVLKNASKYGLDPRTYDIAAIETQVSSLYTPPVDGKSIIDVDIHISEMYFLFTTHLAEGRIRNFANGKNVWKRNTKEMSNKDAEATAEVKDPEQLISLISLLQPVNEQYAKLMDALAYYRSLESQQSKDKAISVKSAIKPGERNPAVPLIRRKLSLTDLKVFPMNVDSTQDGFDSLLYDQTLVEGVKFFQLRHGIEPDGIIGERTLKFMNQSFREKAEVIALNMERLRWTPESYGENYITVNVPEYKLRVYEQHEKAIEMKVIVGSSNKPTPIFTDQLEHIVFSPTWTVPVSIIREEIIPHLRKDSSYYANKNFVFFKNEVEIDPTLENWKDENINPYQFRVVQNPGTDNSLGSVKFMMPNNMSVYLHDTPNHKLFSKDYRALSHGCVRLDEPAKFAEYLLRDQKGWSSERIGKAMNDSTPSTVLLKKHYQVVLEYQTAWVDENGMINFREDIYGHDKAQLKQLQPIISTATATAGM